MRKFAYVLAAGLTAAVLASPASAAVTMQQIDQYGCRWEGRTQAYRCYSGAYAGRTFASQEEMFRNARIVPVYVDDSGAPRPMPPHASRGTSERPATDAGTTEDQFQVDLF